MLSPRLDAASTDSVDDSSALLALPEAELPPESVNPGVGTTVPAELLEPLAANPEDANPGTDFSLVLDEVAAANVTALEPDLTGPIAVGDGQDSLVNNAIAALSVGLLPGTVSVTGTALQFVDGAVGLGGDNNLILTAAGTTLLIQDTLNRLTRVWARRRVMTTPSALI